MPDPHELGPQKPERCAGCGEPLAGGPWWVLEPGRAWHERCAPWHRRSFPLESELRRLRVLRKKLAMAIEAIDGVGRALREAERRWPSDAVILLERARDAIAALEKRLRDLGIRR